jgi:hypothetical protein
MDIYLGHEQSKASGGMNGPLFFCVLAAFALVPLAFLAAVVWFAVTKRRTRFRYHFFAFHGVLLQCNGI